MANTITVRVTDAQAAWLQDISQRTGRSKSRVLREQLEEARKRGDQLRPYLRHAGRIAGPADLSARKGFAKG